MEYQCNQWSTEEKKGRIGAFSALVWTKFWTKPPRADDSIKKSRIQTGSFYLIVEKSAQFGDHFDFNE